MRKRIPWVDIGLWLPTLYLGYVFVRQLAALVFDGEGRFQRDRHGRVSHFVYYEFGRRLGVARKPKPTAASGQ